MKRKDKIAIFSFSFCVCEKKLKGGHEMSKNTKLEKDFQSKLIKELKKMFVEVHLTLPPYFQDR